MSELLRIEDFQNNIEVEFKGFEVHDECVIDPNEDIQRPPIAISVGTGYDGDIPLVTYGNFCCLVGASKSMKSFLKSAIIASYIGGQSNRYFDNFKGHDNKGKYVIDIDTEQGKYHVQKIVKRVNTMVGAVYGGYKGFALRPKEPKERVKFIEWLLNESQYKGRIGLLSIDGVADLIENVNDLESSNEITQKLMKWSSDYNIAIITVLHRNFESSKPTGHLGSAILKKAETVVFLNKNDKIIDVEPKYCRNMPFDGFSFTVNENGLPELTNINF